MALKAVGPVLLGGRELPRTYQSAVELLGPALLSALVVTSVFAAPGGGIGVDERAVGLAAGVVAVLLRAPLLVVVVVAAASTALVRAWAGAA
jgi:branched-subunit amino acid transport protein